MNDHFFGTKEAVEERYEAQWKQHLPYDEEFVNYTKIVVLDDTQV